MPKIVRGGLNLLLVLVLTYVLFQIPFFATLKLVFCVVLAAILVGLAAAAFER